MLPSRAFAVHAVLVEHGGASARDADSFVIAMLNGCEEYRFQGRLGFGGKYRPKTNTVDCYREDMTPERLAVVERTNAALASVDPAPPRG